MLTKEPKVGVYQMLFNDDSNIVSMKSAAARSPEVGPQHPANDGHHLCWLLFIIEDLRQVCDKNNLPESLAALASASKIMENEIFPT